MPRDEYHRALIKALAAVVLATEENDAPRAVEALRTLLDTIVAHRDRPHEGRNEALIRAVERLG